MPKQTEQKEEIVICKHCGKLIKLLPLFFFV